MAGPVWTSDPARGSTRGARELYYALSTKIPQQMEGKLLQKALTAGTAVILKEAKANVGRGGNFPRSITGTLKKAIYAKRGRKSDATQEVRFISIRRGNRAAKSGRDAWYGRLVEYGHRTAKKGSRLMRESNAKTKAGFDRYERKRAAGTIKGLRTSTGRADPHPFMRPAWESKKVEAQQRVMRAIGEQIDKAVREAAWF